MSRPPKNIKDLTLQKGKLYGKQAKRAVVPTKTGKEPRCPTHFTKDQKKVWRKTSLILKERGLFVDMNGPLLEELAWWEWVLIQMRCQISSINDIIASREMGKNPYAPEFSIVKQASEQKQKICSKLGLSSVDAARIGSMVVETNKKRSGLEDLLK